MVQLNCEECMNYWLKNGRDMRGYRCLINEQHIPGAHFQTPKPKSARRFKSGGDGEPSVFGVIPCSADSPPGCEMKCDNSASPTAYCGKADFVEDEDDHFDDHFDDDDEEEKEEEELRRPNDEKPMDDEHNMDKVSDQKTDTNWYFHLYKAAMDGDWESGKHIFDHHGEEALRAKIRARSETALHIAVGSGPGTKFFVKELLEHLLPANLEVKNNNGCTALAIAAQVGNVEAANLLVAKNKNLLYIPSKDGTFPIHSAAEYGQKDMLLYLLEYTQEGQSPDPYDPEGCGPKLLHLIIKAEFYDVALLLLQRMPKLATFGIHSNQSLLILAENPSAFSCWRNDGIFQPLIYTCAPHLQKKQSALHITRDIENAATEEKSSNKCRLYWQRYFVSGLQKIHQVLWSIFEKIVPFLKHFKNEKLKGQLAKKLVKCLCREAAHYLNNSSDAALFFKLPLLLAAENGIHQIVKEITYSFPDAIWYHDSNNSEVFRLAIENRHHQVYNLLYEMGDLYINIVRQSIEEGDNILHLAAKLAPPERRRVVSGAALQMQRELQWFKEIESLVQPAYKSQKNNVEETPQQAFSMYHQQLMEDGEKWMRDTATSCTVAATLIATVVFAAAITVPGGNNGSTGEAILGSEKAFMIFGVADALSLFTSCASVLMFLSILTSRYAEGDFLRALPSRLIIGLISLFLSVASMMVAFSSTLYLMFGHERRWILGCVIAPSSLLVVIFAFMQLSLLAELINNTYLCGIFKRRSKGKKTIGSRGEARVRKTSAPTTAVEFSKRNQGEIPL